MEHANSCVSLESLLGFNRAPLKRKVACDLTAIIHCAQP